MQSVKRCISRVVLPVVFSMTTAPLSSFAQMEEQWPYEIKLSGTLVDDRVIIK